MHSGLRFLDHPGEMAARIREKDWRGHPLGPPETWPQALRFSLNLALASSFPMAIYWGPDFHLLYNDAWSAIPADRHPWALGLGILASRSVDFRLDRMGIAPRWWLGLRIPLSVGLGTLSLIAGIAA